MQQEKNYKIVAITYFISYFITILRIFWSIPIFFNITDFMWFFGTGLLLMIIFKGKKYLLTILLIICILEEFIQLLVPNYMNYNNIMSLFISGTFDIWDIIFYCLSYLLLLLYLKISNDI